MTDISEYDFELPKELIAQQPLPKRADARLLVVDRHQESLTHAYIRDLPEFLSPHDCLVLNDTRVVPARLVGFRTSTGGHWEGLFLSADDEGHWRVLGKARGKLAIDETITLVDATVREAFRLRLLSKDSDGIWLVRPEPLKPEPAATTWQLLDRVGRVPLPHYIRQGEMTESDWQRYQTVFAKEPGSVAAPTAGLHFTPELLQAIEKQGTSVARVTLHVGLGTFRPIATDKIEDHRMHREWANLSQEACDRINACKTTGGRVVCVGTTTVRTLETAGVKQASATASAGKLSSVLKPWSGETDLYIRPGHKFAVVDAMLTNFHLPRSTLLVLVRTFGGDELIKRAYAEAIRDDYRFFSYGDAMLII